VRFGNRPDTKMEIVPDPWLKSIINSDVFRIADFRFNDPNLNSLISEFKIQENAFYYAKIPVTEHSGTIRQLLDLGFKNIEINTVLERKPGPVIKPDGLNITIRLARPDESRILQNIAAVCFSKSRFHRDEQIPKKIADSIKKKWVENYFNGERGECIYVAAVDEKPVGFLAVMKITAENQTIRIIDLIGIHPKFQKCGIGDQMVKFFIQDSLGKCNLLRVGTQLINIPSLHLYEKNGFQISDASYVLHAHIRNGSVIPDNNRQ